MSSCRVKDIYPEIATIKKGDSNTKINGHGLVGIKDSNSGGENDVLEDVFSSQEDCLNLQGEKLLGQGVSFKKETVKMSDIEYLSPEDGKAALEKTIIYYDSLSGKDRETTGILVETGVDTSSVWIDEFTVEVPMECFEESVLATSSTSTKPAWEGFEDLIFEETELSKDNCSIVDSSWEKNEEGISAIYVIRQEKYGTYAKYEYQADMIIDFDEGIFAKVKKNQKLLDSYRGINDEVYGLVKIDGTKVNHPIMKSEDEGFYLWHDLYKNYNSYGVPFVTKISDLEKTGGNSMIYGHRLDDQDVFGSLSEYEDVNYYKEHPYIETVTDKGSCRWLIFAYVLVCNEDEDAFRYFENYDFSSKKEYEEYMEQVRKRNWLDVPVDVGIEDTYLTLSSCSKEKTGIKTNRMMIMAVRVEYDADYSDVVKNSRRIGDPLLPDNIKN